MKACPICRAMTFDDAEVCYGCMHRFAEKAGYGGVFEEGTNWEPDEGVRPLARPLQEKGSAPIPESGVTPSVSRVPTRREMADAAFRPAQTAASTGGSDYGSALSAKEPERRDIEFESLLAGHTGQRVNNSSPDAAPSLSGAQPQQTPPTREVVAEPSRNPGVLREKVNPKSTSSAAPFDYAGWIVRFDFPGCETRALDESRASTGSASLPVGALVGSGSGVRRGSFVVSISPAGCGVDTAQGALASKGSLYGQQVSSRVLPESAEGVLSC